MTCVNCVAKVKSELLKIGDVLEADVQLSTPQATVTMQKHIAATLQKAINKAGNYTISEAAVHHGPDEKINTESSDWKSYWPLFLVFCFIIGIAAITSFQQGIFHWMIWMNHFMGGFFIAFSFFKLLDLRVLPIAILLMICWLSGGVLMAYYIRFWNLHLALHISLTLNRFSRILQRLSLWVLAVWV